MSHDVFISYSSRDQDKLVADAACTKLESRGIRCWIAPRDIIPGKAFAEAIIEGIDKTRVFVLVFSSTSNQSPHIAREVQHAVSKGVPIVPVRIENVTPAKGLEYFLSDTHWLDALTPPLNTHLDKLAETVSLLIAQDETPPTPTSDEPKEAPAPKTEPQVSPVGKLIDNPNEPPAQEGQVPEAQLPNSRLGIASLSSGVLGAILTAVFWIWYEIPAGASDSAIFMFWTMLKIVQIFNAVAIFLGLGAIYQIVRKTRRGTGMALAGVALGAICIIYFIAVQ